MFSFYHQDTIQSPNILQLCSRKLLRIPILRMSAHHRISQCVVLHDIRNGSPRQLFCVIVSHSGHQHNRYEARGGWGPILLMLILYSSSLYNPAALHGSQLSLNPLNSSSQSSPPSLFAGAGCYHECNVRFCANVRFLFLTFFNVKSVTVQLRLRPSWETIGFLSRI